MLTELRPCSVKKQRQKAHEKREREHGRNSSLVNIAAMAKKQSKHLSDPMQLKPIDFDDDTLQVIIETPKGSRNKYAFDSKQKIFALKKVLPAGMAFPYDFGFLPHTLAPDGDPIDVLLLMDEPAFPGCVIKARLIGVIEGEQVEDKKTTRNDRLVAIAEANHMYANIKKLKDLPPKALRELQDFFVNYHRLEGKEYKLLGCKGKRTAMALITKARRAA
jgi:inorganic pyrophosphatase